MLALAHMPFKLQIYAKSLGYSNLTEIFSKLSRPSAFKMRLVVGDRDGADEYLAEGDHGLGGGDVERTHTVAENLEHAAVVAGVDLGDYVVASRDDMAFGYLGNLADTFGKRLYVGSGHGADTEVCHDIEADSRRVDDATRTGYDFVGYQTLHTLMDSSPRHSIFSRYLKIGRARVFGKRVKNAQIKVVKKYSFHKCVFHVVPAIARTERSVTASLLQN